MTKREDKELRRQTQEMKRQTREMKRANRPSPPVAFTGDDEIMHQSIVEKPMIGSDVHYTEIVRETGHVTCRAAIITDIPLMPEDEYGKVLDLFVMVPSLTSHRLRIPYNPDTRVPYAWHWRCGR